MSGRHSMLVDPGGGLPVAPLIDVVLLLLIFFMLISHFLPPSLLVTLPEASAAVADSTPAISLSIAASGQLSVDGNLAEWDALPDHLAAQTPETQVRIAADKTVDYNYVIRALDAAAQANLRHIALETTLSD